MAEDAGGLTSEGRTGDPWAYDRSQCEDEGMGTHAEPEDGGETENRHGTVRILDASSVVWEGGVA